MHLTKEQLSEIENYLKTNGIKYYDVRIELVDHFANILEQKFDENPNINFKREIENIHKNFSDKGFSKLLKEKRNSVTKKFYKQSLQYVITLFELPKILITISVFALLIFIMNYVNDKETFFGVLSFILIFLGFRLLFNVNIRDTKKETFLVLNMTMNFFNAFYVCVMLFNFFIRDIKEESYLSSTHNYFWVTVFMLLILFYWSGEHVYYKTKKLVKQQYPNIAI